MNYKKKIAEEIKSKVDMELEVIEKLIEIPPQTEMGDYAFPCFQLAKIFRRDPNIIAKELKNKLNQDCFEKVENLGAYVNLKHLLKFVMNYQRNVFYVMKNLIIFYLH